MDRRITVNVNGSYIDKDATDAGVQYESNVTELAISLDSSWAEYAKTVTFWNALMTNPVKRILTAEMMEKDRYILPIPGEALCESGEMTFVIDGYLEGKRRRSISDTLHVQKAPYAEEATEPQDPTPTLAEQLQLEIERLKIGDPQWGKSGNGVGALILNDTENNCAEGDYSIASGNGTKAMAKYAHAEGKENTVLGENGHAEGDTNTVKDISGHAEGGSNTVCSKYSHAEGLLNTVESGAYTSHVEGLRNTVCGNVTHAEGEDTTASGNVSHAQGKSTTASGDMSHAEGRGTVASGAQSHAGGYYTTASGEGAFAHGISAEASGYGAFAIGKGTASGECAFAQGDADTIASGRYAFAAGWKTNAKGSYSFAQGIESTANGYGSHVLGANCVTEKNATFAHAEGASTHAQALASHAQGRNTVAQGVASHAGGTQTIAQGENATAIGRFNAPNDTDLFQVGNGADNERKNAFSVKTDGSAEVQTQGETDHSVVILSYFKEQWGNLDTVLETILALQESYIGGEDA